MYSVWKKFRERVATENKQRRGGKKLGDERAVRRLVRQTQADRKRRQSDVRSKYNENINAN